MKLRPPATPLITHDPYFSVWCDTSPLANVMHWTGSPNTMIGTVSVDGEVYRFLGKVDYVFLQGDPYPIATLEKSDIDAFSTAFTYKAGSIRLRVKFTSPVLPTDLYLSSRPVSYCHISYEALDSKEHKVSVRLFCSEEFVLNKRGEDRAWSEECKLEGASCIKMGSGEQKVLWRSGDDVRIDWGYLYLGVKGEAHIGNSAQNGLYGVWVEKELENDALFFFAYDDIESMVYFGDRLKAYWKNDGKTITEAISEALSDYDVTLARCNDFSQKLREDAISCGSEEYADLLELAVRQVMAGHKLVVDKDGKNLFISKECFSNGCGATVDVTYPSSPLFLLYNTELMKGMLRPIMKYAASDAWQFDFAPHDVGQYPHINGQFYYPNNIKNQMPVEECGNMIILFAAICDRDENCDFAKEYLDTIKAWSEYLIKYGEDPEHQLCTDDFAGHLAHNVNLSIKAIMGIAGFSRILEKLGENEEASRLMEIARRYAASLVERAKNSDGSFRLAYDKPETFSLKYNTVWDKVWKTNLFPKEFYEGEIERYKKEMLPYGIPLDSREKYTKSDWLVWAACLAEKREDFDLLTGSLWKAYNTTRSRVPLSDWLWCDTSECLIFRHRTVQGGLFMKLML